MAELKKRDDDFTPAEMIEYETIVREPLSEIENGDKPRLKKFATLGWLRARRENPDLTIDQYIAGAKSFDEIMKDAFGDQSEEKKEKTN